MLRLREGRLCGGVERAEVVAEGHAVGRGELFVEAVFDGLESARRAVGHGRDLFGSEIHEYVGTHPCLATGKVGMELRQAFEEVGRRLLAENVENVPYIAVKSDAPDFAAQCVEASGGVARRVVAHGVLYNFVELGELERQRHEIAALAVEIAHCVAEAPAVRQRRSTIPFRATESRSLSGDDRDKGERRQSRQRASEITVGSR